MGQGMKWVVGILGHPILDDLIDNILVAEG